MIIRPATPKDLPDIGLILDACDLRVESVDYADWTGWLLVAERQGQVIGLIHVIPAKPYSIIAEYGVLPEFQKGRAAHKLIEAAELLLRTNGLPGWAAYVGDRRNGFHATITEWGGVNLGLGSMYWRAL